MEIGASYEYKPTRPGGPEIAGVPLPENFTISTFDFVKFKPGTKGGNHSHPRTEVFVALGPLTLHVLEKDGVRKINMGTEEERYTMFVMPPNVPHAITNDTNEEIVLLELADQEMDPSTKKKVEIV